MSDIGIGSNGKDVSEYDLLIKDNDFVLVVGMQETAQACKFKCLSIENDFYENIKAGIPYFDDIFSPRLTDRIKALYFEKACKAAPRVTSANVVYFEGERMSIDIITENESENITL
jgi:hypothetical protein